MGKRIDFSLALKESNQEANSMNTPVAEILKETPIIIEQPEEPLLKKEEALLDDPIVSKNITPRKNTKTKSNIKNNNSKPYEKPVTYEDLTEELKTVCLYLDNDIYNHIKERAYELDITIRKYIKIIISEYRIKIETEGITIDKELSQIIKENPNPKFPRPVVLPIELVHWVKAAAAAHKMKLTEFLSYMLYLEFKREDIYGKRKGKYEYKYTFIINE